MLGSNTIFLLLTFECSASHVRAAVATLGGKHGAAGRSDKWRHLYAGFTVWLSQTEASVILADMLFGCFYKICLQFQSNSPTLFTESAL